MAVLGWAVRDGPTPVDDWFQAAHGSALRWLLFFTDYRTVAVLLLAALGCALYRQKWWTAALVFVTPVVAVWLSRVLKHAIGRHKGDAVAYPSGHTTLAVVVLGMVILAVGARFWLLLASGVWAVLGMLGQAVTYHYFTDTVGGLLLGTSLVCLAAVVIASVAKCDGSAPSR
ncbi:PA-phosphatase [Mycolicibacterium litorale]|nr:PA-phosphatase [Mycolicibacterium litorale]